MARHRLHVVRSEVNGRRPGGEGPKWDAEQIEAGVTRGRLHWGTDGLAPVVLVHGWAADGWSNWRFVEQALAGRTILTVDLPGHGASRVDGPFSLERCAEAVAGLCDTSGVCDAVVCGYSLGGPVTQLLARERPDLVGGMVMVATGARLVPTAWGRAVLPGVSQLGRVGLSALATVAMVVPHRREDDLWSHAVWMARHADAGALARAGAELARYDAREWVGDLGIDAASVITVADRAVPADSQRELAELLGVPPERRFEVAASHTLCLEGRFGTVVHAAVTSLGR